MVNKKTTKNVREIKQEIIYTRPLNEMIMKMANEPAQKMIYSGIRDNSTGFIFGPSKSGKTTFCENLGMCIAAGIDNYLGRPIQAENRKVLFISLEEFCGGRTERNRKQIKKITESIGNDEWINNYIVADCAIPRYITSNEDWDIIRKQIEKHKPGIVFLDSLSRMHGNDPIEDSTVAIKLMKRLRELSNDLQVTIAVIHHTPKLATNSPLNIFAMAGSRVLAQDADFIIGMALLHE
jgi:RecA-family ATPase